jgi:hypothetical protein
MDIDGSTKRRRFIKAMKILCRHFELVNMSDYAKSVAPAASKRIVPAARP